MTEPKRRGCARFRKYRMWLIGLVILVVVGAIIGGIGFYIAKKDDKHPCADAAERIIDAAMNSPSLAYPRLGYMCNTFGNRLSGSQSLELALDWIVQEMAKDNLSNPHHEPVMVPTWIRGTEYLNMVTPFSRPLGMLGLGGSANTNGSVITAKVIVVSSLADLQNKSSLVPGNIVLFNVNFTTYGQTVRYRSSGGTEASKYGAVAALVRSIAPYSLYTPHTGGTGYNTTAAPAIPFAAITIEDSQWMQYLYDQGTEITVSLYMESHFLNDSLSSNIMAEVTGSEFPNEVVAIGGHTDSWDVGQGAMDDGGGVFVSWEAVRLLHTLGLKPKRTVRVVGWVNEENGLRGGNAYALAHANETHVFAIESDGGATTPLGLQVYPSLSDGAVSSLQKIGKLLDKINAGGVERGGGGADIEPLVKYGVPIAGLWTDMTRYFWYHHTNADTFDKMDDTEMRKCVATMAVMSYCVADADEALPRLG
eukprot:Phypoly_transcript_07736.p1 GENE.Phypoly_transcript_07736~~Phypoly_transcript_07736.p1  ORF type:complete len:522 (+),score=65.84 Phypoly_transcript_07736:135-1568(+)